MHDEVELKSPIARAIFLALCVLFAALLLRIIFSRFVVGTLADERVFVARSALVSPVNYFPDSARLNARLATAELMEPDADLLLALEAGERAVKLSPWDYRFRLILANAQVASNELSLAETSLREARRLAPFNKDVRYQLGNLLVREGKLSDALEELRAAVNGGSKLFAGTLDLVWRASNEQSAMLEAVVGTDAKSRLQLAMFLLKQDRVEEAARAFRQLDRATRLSASESGALLEALIARREFELARSLWLETTGAQLALLFNGGFEEDLYQNLAQFGWRIASSSDAKTNIESGAARTGSRCLRIDDASDHANRSETELRQLILVNAGARYRLTCFIRTNQCEGADRPRLIVLNHASPDWIVASDPADSKTAEWQELTLTFTSPSAAGRVVPLSVSVARRPSKIDEKAARCTVWLDDFALTEIGAEAKAQNYQSANQRR